MAFTHTVSKLHIAHGFDDVTLAEGWKFFVSSQDDDACGVGVVDLELDVERGEGPRDIGVVIYHWRLTSTHESVDALLNVHGSHVLGFIRKGKKKLINDGEFS